MRFVAVAAVHVARREHKERKEGNHWWWWERERNEYMEYRLKVAGQPWRGRRRNDPGHESTVGFD